MPRMKWKLSGAGEIEEWGEGEGSRFGRRVTSVLARLADDPRSGFEVIGPGVYRGPKAP